MKLPEHHLADKGYAYVEPSDILGAKVSNASHDAVYLVKGSRTFVVALNGQDHPLIEYGIQPKEK